jgi:anthrone oxygenase-like protein
LAPLTLAGNVPVNVRALRWDVGADDPIDWRRLRKRWDRLHALRTGLDLGGLAALTAASLRAPR